MSKQNRPRIGRPPAAKPAVQHATPGTQATPDELLTQSITQMPTETTEPEITPTPQPYQPYEPFQTPSADFNEEEEYEDDDVLEEEVDNDDKIIEEEYSERPVLFTLVKAQGATSNLTREDGSPIDSGYPRAYYIPCEDTIVYHGKDEDANGKTYNNRNRKIRYIPGETSIYKDEQSEDAEIAFGAIVFTEGVLRVNKNENPLLLEYLRSMNHNQTNPHGKRRKKVFYEVVIGAKEKADDSLIDLRYEAVGKVNTLVNQDLLIYCKYVGIQTRGQKVIQLKTELKKYAEKFPKDFLEIFKDAKFKIKQLFILAQDRRVVSYTEVPNALVWINQDKRTPIVNIPAGEDVLDFLAQWATLKEGNATFNLIKQKTKDAGRR